MIWLHFVNQKQVQFPICLYEKKPSQEARFDGASIIISFLKRL